MADQQDDPLPGDKEHLVPADKDDLVRAEKKDRPTRKAEKAKPPAQSEEDLLSELSEEMGGAVSGDLLSKLGEEAPGGVGDDLLEELGEPAGGTVDGATPAKAQPKTAAAKQSRPEIPRQQEAKPSKPPPQGKGFKQVKESAVRWVKENPNVAKGALAGVLLLAMILIFGLQLGWFSSGQKPPTRTIAPGQRPAVPPIAKGPSPAPGGQQTQKTGKTVPGVESKTPKATQPPEPPSPKPKPQKVERPKDFALWTEKDFKDARGEKDQQLAQAVEQLGQGAAIDATKVPDPVKLLAELLAPPKPEQDPAKKPRLGPRRYGSGGGKSLIDAVVKALGSYHNEASRAVLQELLAGTRPSDDDKAATLAALTVLAEPRPCPIENQLILFEALTNPEQFRPKGQQQEGKVTADDLWKEALKLVPPIASEKFRAGVAKRLILTGVPADRKKSLGEFLEKKDPKNVEAQLILYGHKKTPQQTKTKFETQFFAWSSQALGKLLGLAPVQRTGAVRSPLPRQPARDTTQLDLDVLCRAVRQLWSDPFVEPLLAEVESLEEQKPLVLLAATIPVDSTRAALYQALHEHWADGGKSLEAATLATEVTDPGLVLVVKAVVKSGAPSRAVAQEHRGKHEQISDQWLKVLSLLIGHWCERLYATQQARAEQGGSQAAEPGVSKPAFPLPFQLHAGAQPVAQYQAVWPRHVGAKLPDVNLGPMKIDYVRIEQEAAANKMVDFYRRRAQVRKGDERPMEGDKGYWLDGFSIVPNTNRKRSVDVLITGAEEKFDPKSKEPQELVIEILAIEMKDPAGKP